jgi:AraC-like DNA-binding protein/mannose-6-phosphate isomerase-like protein (cupin superfamily)
VSQVDLSHVQRLKLHEFTLGRPYHAAFVRISSRDRGATFHTHDDFYEVFYVVGGYGDHRAPFGSQPLRSGDLVLVRPADCHYFAGAAPIGLELINVAMPIATWESIWDEAEIGSADDWVKATQPKVLTLPDEAKAMAESAFREALSRGALNPTKSDLLRFIVQVLELFEGSSRVAEGPSLPEWLARACTTMRREENLRAGVHRFVQVAGVSHGHLCRALQAHYTTTPTEFVTDLRLRHSEMLMATTSASLTEIADRCGFANLSYFSRCFSSTRGVSPREFRRGARRAVLP